MGVDAFLSESPYSHLGKTWIVDVTTSTVKDSSVLHRRRRGRRRSSCGAAGREHHTAVAASPLLTSCPPPPPAAPLLAPPSEPAASWLALQRRHHRPTTAPPPYRRIHWHRLIGCRDRRSPPAVTELPASFPAAKQTAPQVKYVQGIATRIRSILNTKKNTN